MKYSLLNLEMLICDMYVFESIIYMKYSAAWGAACRVLGARAPTKIPEEILQWAGTHKVLAEKVSGYGNFW